MTVQGIEITENFLRKILNYQPYKELKMFDFHYYDELLKKLKGHIFEKEEDFKKYKMSMINGVKLGVYDKPKLKIKKDGSVVCVDGLVRLLTSKVLGIDPVVELSTEENSNISIDNYRLVSTY
jgi:hypothetical protein